jgi:maltose alpha-D-glucosyltransferase/alpha-amylase
VLWPLICFDISVLDLWYKNAIVYCVDVQTFMDSNGDGFGDFPGLAHRLDHISNLGSNCIWLMPFYPSPNRDERYDVLDYYGVDSHLGTLGDFVSFTREAHERGIRVIVDLVVNHTSIDHPWFQEARRNPRSKYRNYYLWQDQPPANASEGVVFPGYQESTWSYDTVADSFYFHRFYDHQPDLNFANPEVQEEIESIMGFWLELGISGFRLDAAPFLIELKGTNQQRETHDPYRYLRRLRDVLSWRRGGAILLAEANVSAEEILKYFGDGDRMHMLFGFLINQYAFLTLARQDAEPLRRILESLPHIPPLSQWANFLRNHDELDLGRLSTSEREEVFQAFAPQENMRLYSRGIRRRLAPMLNNDRRRLELAYALLFSLPGTPVIFYGEETGMGEDLNLPERNAVRTPMQWSAEVNGGFSEAPHYKLIRTVIKGGEYGYERVNVTAQSRDPGSLLNKVRHILAARRAAPEFGWGEFSLVSTDNRQVMAHRCDWRGNSVLALHNLSNEPCEAGIELEGDTPKELTDVLSDQEYPALSPAVRRIPLRSYGYRWLRLDGTRR